MPVRKDLKRLVRTRMQKTGESYTAARLQLVKKTRTETPKPDYAALAGISEAALRNKTGRSWSEWVEVLDGVRANERPHREIARYVSSLGTPDWWSQTVTVGYERIRGLREIGQRRGGGYEASKSRVFGVDVKKLFTAFSNVRTRKRWIPDVKLKIRSASPNKAMSIVMDDGTVVLVGFYPKGAAKSQVAVQHTKLASRADVDKTKAFWAERFNALEEVFAKGR